MYTAKKTANAATLKESAGLIEQLRAFRRALTAEELAGLFACSVDTVYRMAATGKLPSFRVQSNLRFDAASVIAWLQRQGVS